MIRTFVHYRSGNSDYENTEYMFSQLPHKGEIVILPSEKFYQVVLVEHYAYQNEENFGLQAEIYCVAVDLATVQRLRLSE